MPEFILRISTPEGTVREQRIAAAEITIGRHPDNDVVLADSIVSNRHAVLQREGSTYRIMDLGGFNGILLGGRYIREKLLAPGDEIVIGESQITFLSEGSAPIRAFAAGGGRAAVAEPGEGMQARAPRTTASVEWQADVVASAGEVLDAVPRRGLVALQPLLGRFSADLAVDRVALARRQGPRGRDDVLACYPATVEMRPTADAVLVARALTEARPVFSRGEHGGEAFVCPLAVGGRPTSHYLYAERSFGAPPLTASDRHSILSYCQIVALTLHSAELVGSLRAANALAQREGELLRRELWRDLDLSQFRGRSKPLREVVDAVRRFADSAKPIHLEGEPGTGKSFLASIIHLVSTRSPRPFASLSCRTPYTDTLERELFGTEDPGGVAQAGLVELAAGGTLLLEDVDHLTPGLQHRLFRFIDEGTFLRGEEGGAPVPRVRLLTSSCLGLRDAVESGRLREDLFYRLNVVHIKLPSLRAIPEDIPLLADHFTTVHARALHKHVAGITPEAAARLREYSWPGNTRELALVIELAVVRAEEGASVTADDISSWLVTTGQVSSEPATLPVIRPLAEEIEALERRRIAEALKQTGGNKARSAALLGISRETLRTKIRRYEIGA